MDNSIEIVKKEEIKKIKEKHDFVFSSCVMILAIVSLFPVFIFLFGLLENIFYLVFYIGLIILAFDITLFPFEKYRGLFIEILVPIGILGLVLVFTGIGGLAISRNPESDIFLTFWYKGGVQFLIIIILISGIIHLYLRKILLCNYHIKLINSYDETFFKKHLEKGVNMSKWVNKEEVSWLKVYHSTDERRLVSVASDKPLEVFPISKRAYRAPMFRREYDSFAFVNMEQRTVDVEITGNVITADGVRLEGTVGIQSIIKDDEKYIKRIVANEDEEESIFKSIILEVVRNTIACEKWCNLVPVQERISEKVKEKLLEVLSKTDKEGELLSCFQFRSLTWKEIRPKDKELAESLENKTKELAEIEHKKELAFLREEARTIERERETAEEKYQIEIKRLRQEMDMEVRRNVLQLTKEERDMQIEFNKILSDLLQSEAGRLAVYPEEMFKVLIEELKVKFADKKEVIKMYQLLLNTKQSYQAGQVSAFKTFMEQNLGIQWKEGEIDNMFPKELGVGTKEENKKTGSDEKETKAEDEADNQKGDTEENSNKTSKLNEEETKPEENT